MRNTKCDLTIFWMQRRNWEAFNMKALIKKAFYLKALIKRVFYLKALIKRAF